MRKDRAEEFTEYARHGFAFLRDHMWDEQHGGFFWAVDENGQSLETSTDKHAYGIAFAMYACVNVFEVTGDRAALDLAMKGFRWLEEHAHDAKNGGYFEAFTRDGKPIMNAAMSEDASNPNDSIGTPYGYKSMNTHIHLMEALTSLAEIGRASCRERV